MKGQIVKIVSNLCSVECEDQVFEKLVLSSGIMSNLMKKINTC